MKNLPARDRSGSHAGRGFRYQDAVTAWLAVRSWADPPLGGIVIPEGGDDVERRTGTGRRFIQVKSRRAHLGPLPVAEARDHLVGGLLPGEVEEELLDVLDFERALMECVLFQ